MKKAKFIINAAVAKSGVLNQIESYVGCLILNQVVNHVDVAYTYRENEAMIEAMKMQKGEYDFVTVVGGDGTVHDVINGVINSGNETPIAIISTGTSNSFANILKLESDRDGFCKMIMQMKVMCVDVGKVNDKYFINSAVCGIWSGHMFGTSLRRKEVFGKSAYLMEFAKSVPAKMMKTVSLQLKSEEFTGTKEVVLFIAKNSGSMNLNKNEETQKMITDGLLDILLIEKMDVKKISVLFFKFMQGEHLNAPGVIFFQTKALDVKQIGGEPVILDFDKEMYGELPVHIEAIPSAVKIILP